MNTTTGGLLALLLALGTAAAAAQEPNPDIAALTLRLRTLDAAPANTGAAALERLQAQQALDALATARRSEVASVLQIAQWRVETAELAVQTALARRQMEAIERERGEWLLEASRREAARALQEAERLRIQAQIQAEETERLRQLAEAEAQARQEAETRLDEAAGAQAARLRAARQRAAELKRQEDALRRRLEQEQQSSLPNRDHPRRS